MRPVLVMVVVVVVIGHVCWLLVGDGLVGASGGLSLRTLRLFQRSVTVGWIRMESLRPSKGSEEGETFLGGVYGVTSPLNPTCISSMVMDADDRWIEFFSNYFPFDGPLLLESLYATVCLLVGAFDFTGQPGMTQ